MIARDELLTALQGALHTYSDWTVATVIAQAAGAHHLAEYSDEAFTRRFTQLGANLRPPRRSIRNAEISGTFVLRIDQIWPVGVSFGAFIAAVRDAGGETMLGRLSDGQFAAALAAYIAQSAVPGTDRHA